MNNSYVYWHLLYGNKNAVKVSDAESVALGMGDKIILITIIIFLVLMIYDTFKNWDK